MAPTTAPISTTTPPPHWSSVTTQQVAGSFEPLSVQLLLSPQGSGFLGATPVDRRHQPLSSYRSASQVRAIDTAGSLSKPFKLKLADGALASGAFYGSHALMLQAPNTSSATSLALHDLSPSGKLARSQPVPIRNLVDYRQVSATSTGAAIVAWTEKRAKRPTILAMAERMAGGRISARAALTTTTPYTFDTAVGPGGRWVIAAAVTPTTGDNSIPHLLVWTGIIGRPGRHRIDLTLAPYETSEEIAIDGAGRIYLALRNQVPGTDFFDNAAQGPYKVRVASIAPDGRTVTPPQEIASGHGYGGFTTLRASPTTGATLLVTGSTFDASEATGDDDAPGTVSFTTVNGDGLVAHLSAPLAGAVDPGPLTYRADGTAIATWADARDRHLFSAVIAGGQISASTSTGLPGNAGAVFGRTPSGALRLYGVRTAGTSVRLLSSTLAGT